MKYRYKINDYKMIQMKNVFSFIMILLSFLIVNSCSHKDTNIKIGVILPLSGKMANYGKSSQSALIAMQTVINEERETNGKPLLELIIEDNQLEVKEGVNAINKLITQDKVVSIIGPHASSITLGVAPIAEKNHTVLISPGSTSSDVTNAGDYIFRTILSGDYEGKVAANLYKEMNSSQLAIMYINNEYGISLKNSFIKNIKGKPIEIPYSENETDFKSLFSKIKNYNCDVVYLIGYNEMIQIFHQATEMNLGVTWLGTAQIGSQSLIDKIGKPAEGIIFPSWVLDIDKIKRDNPIFFESYNKLSDNQELDAFAANAVDALLALDKAIGKDNNPTSENIKKRLNTVESFDGLTGKFSFDINGDVIKEIGIKTIVSGKIVDYVN